jgi:WD40 repeat protein/DNA-binding SARP family transcriptional activator
MEFRILGPLEVRGEAGGVSLGGIKPRAVLAMLLLHTDEPVSAERLAQALWGDDAPRGAVKTVQVHVSRLRKALGDGEIVATTPAGYRLRVRPGELDAERFARLLEDGRRALADGQAEHAAAVLREALGLWRGPALADLAFEPFAQAEIARLEEQRLAALEARVEADLAVGRHVALIEELQQLVAANPTRERLVGQLMLALYRCGRQAEALEAYRRVRRVLITDIGVEPGPELRALQEAILRQDVSLEPQQAVADLPGELDASAAPRLVGRGAELGWLRERWKRASSGAGALVTVVGAPGIGKSRLAAELAGEAYRGGASVLYVAATSPAGAVRAALSRCREAARPTLLVVDDADQADADVLAELAELTRVLATVPVLALASGDDAAALARLDPDGSLTLEPLDADAVRAIAVRYAPGHSAKDVPAERLLDASGGVPRRVHELAGQWARREAARRVGAVAGRAAAGRAELRSIEAELAGDVVELQAASEQAPLLAGAEAPVVCPFKGLASFELADAPYFFGRERLVAELVARLVGTPLLGIVGPSGSGKSSVLRAGLLPALAGGVLPGSDTWAQAIVRPGTHPPRELKDAVADLRGERGFVLAVDQFEETFTTCRDEEERATFIAELMRLAHDEQGPRAVVLVVRADHYGRCADYPELSRLLAANQVLVGPMRRDELRRAVECPAQRAGLRVERELTEALVADVEDASAALPLLSTALLELWQRRNGRRLHLAAYEESGGVRGAVARLAEDAFRQLAPAQRPVARNVLMRLVTEGPEGAVERRRVPLAELEIERSEDVARAVALLTDRRLVTVSQGSVELAHEALLREWPRLAGWIEENRDSLRLHRSASSAAEEWQRLGRDEGALYRGIRLTETVEWSDRRVGALNQLEREFLDASRERARRERTARRRRVRLAFVALTAALLAIGAVAVLAVNARNDAEAQRDIAVSRQLAANAADVLSSDQALGLALALRAVAAAPTEQAANILRRATLEARTLAVMRGHAGRVYSATFSPDGRRAASAGRDGTVRIWDVGRKRLLATVRGHVGAAYQAVYSPDGRRIASSGEDGTVAMFDALGRGREIVASLEGAQARSVAFDRDGHRLAIGSSDGTVRLASVDTRGGDTVLGRHAAEVGAVRFSPDGRRVASGSADGTARIWDVASGVHQRLRGSKIFVAGLGFSRDGRRLVTAEGDGSARIWDLASGARTTVLRQSEGPLIAAAFGPDGQRVVTAGTSGTVDIWDVRSGMKIATLRGHRSRVFDASFSAQGDRAISAGEDGSVRIWDPGATRVFAVPALSGAAVARDADRLEAWAGADGDVRLLRPTDGRVDAVLPGRVQAVRGAAVSSDGRLAVAAGTDRIVRVWDLQTRTVTRLRGHSTELSVAELSPDGTRALGAAVDGRTIVWQLPRGNAVAVLHGPRLVLDAGFGPDGQRIGTASQDGKVRIWPVRTVSRPSNEFQAHREAANAVAFSPNDRSLVTAGSDGTVRVWSAGGSQQRVLRGHSGQQVYAAAFSPDGSRIATGGIDGSVTIWSPNRPEPLVVLAKHEDEILSVDFTGDGRWVMSAAADDTIRMTPCEVCGSLASVQALARQRAFRQLTPDERARFLPDAK